MSEAELFEQASKARSERISYYMQIFAAVAGILSASIAAITFYFSQTTNGITVTIAEPVPLINSEKIQNQNIKIQISVAGTAVERLWLQSIQYENKARTAVRQSDIQDATRITFVGKKVIGAQVRTVIPANFSIESKIQGDQIILEHGLMNPGDLALIDVFLDGNDPETVSCSFRIVNMKECLISNLVSRSQFYLTLMALPSPLRDIVVFLSFLMALFVFGFGFSQTTKEARRAIKEFASFSWTTEEGISLNEVLRRLGIVEEVSHEKIATKIGMDPEIESRVKGKTFSQLFDEQDAYSLAELKLIYRNYVRAIRTAINLKTPYHTYGSPEFDALEESVSSLGDIAQVTKQYFYKQYRSPRALSEVGLGGLVLVVIGMLIVVLGGPARTLLASYFYR